MTLVELANKYKKDDERVVEISPFLVIRIMPDKSVLAYRNNGIQPACSFTLSREYIESLERLTR